MRNQSGASEVKEFFTVLRRWSDFAGRSSRREYWMYTLVLVLISFVLGILDAMILGEAALSQLFTFGNVFSLATLVPSLSVSVRRLHDIDKSGWWLLITLTGVGILLIICWACLTSDEDENRYGAPVPAHPVPSTVK
ncbi:DUF805 domain-containing protein [Luminiphilus sp.]|nr:DUF805 domain-containing protein [Luminiphilus sp.]